MISVIMNCLNGEAHLRPCLDSLMAQTCQDFEVIFYDNASTDSTPQIAQSYGPKIRYVRGESTIPLGAARNRAIAEAKGEFIAFLDCDDLWLKDKLERQLALFANEKVGLVCTDTAFYDGTRTLSRIFDGTRPARGMVFAELMERQWISMSSAMVRKSALDTLLTQGESWFDERLNVCEEADVFYRIAHDWELDYVDAPLTLWRVHGQNTTFRKFAQFAEETLYILDKHKRIYPDYVNQHAGLVALLTRRAAFQKAVALWREGHNAQARATIAPYRNDSRKHKLFWWASYLPGACFDVAARCYFALPAFLRR